MRTSFELATTKTSMLNPKVKALTIAAAGVSLSKQTMHRTHDREVETLGQAGNRQGRKTLHRSYARCFGTPRSPWEPRLYGGRFWVSNAKLQIPYGEAGKPQKPVKPIVFLCRLRLSGINI